MGGQKGKIKRRVGDNCPFGSQAQRHRAVRYVCTSPDVLRSQQRSAQTIRQKWLAAGLPAGRCAPVDPESGLGNGRGGVVSAGGIPARVETARARHASPRLERPPPPPPPPPRLRTRARHRLPSRGQSGLEREDGWREKEARPPHRFGSDLPKKTVPSCHGGFEQRCNCACVSHDANANSNCATGIGFACRA